MWKKKIEQLYGNRTLAAFIEASKKLHINLENIDLEITNGSSFAVKKNENKVRIDVTEKVELFRGLSFLKGNDLVIQVEQRACFETLGFMIDVSRNAVLTLEALKNLIQTMSYMGFNMAMMYTEDVYELKEYPSFGYMRGRYSQEELKELDEYAEVRGIELIPCIQTLGHLENALKWPDMIKYRDTPGVLMVGDESVYEFIEQMIQFAADTYRSKRIHLGMDEAMDLGLGNYLRKNGYQNGFHIIETHLKKVEHITEKYGLKPMIWSDMYFRLGSPENLYYDENCSIPSSVINNASKNISLVYWDYYHKTEQFYDDYFAKHKEFNTEVFFAGGMWTWVGAAVNYPLFFKTSLPGLESCKRNHIKHVFLTAWGDNGAEASILAFLPGLQVYSEYCYSHNFEMDMVSKRFLQCTGERLEQYLAIGRFDSLPSLEHLVNDVPNPAKFLLFQDPLVGLFDEDIKDLNMTQHYKEIYELFQRYQGNSKETTILFEFYTKMAKLLFYKADLGNKIYDAYQNRNNDELRKLSEEALGQAITAAEELRIKWRELWFLTNKSFGFEVIDIRMGGLLARLESTRYRLNQYLEKTILKIEELECMKIPVLRGKNVSGLEGIYLWNQIVTACKM